MSYVTGRHWAEAAQRQGEELGSALAQTNALVQRHHERRQDVAKQATKALEELTEALLPSLDPSAIARAASVAGYPNLVAANLAAQMAKERNELAAHIARIEASPTFVQRDHLFDHRGGKLVLEHGEVSEAQRLVRETFVRCDHPRMWHLVTVGYGTPDYAVPFWRVSYYQDWEAGDAILERWPGKTFAEVRAELLTAQEADRSLTARLGELDNLISAGRALVRDHAESREKLVTIVERYLRRSRDQLGRHVLEAGAAAMGPRLSAEADLDVLGKRLFGLKAKLAYLDGIEQTQLDALRRELEAGILKTKQEVTKYSRPKKANATVSVEAYQRRFRPRAPRYQKAWQRYQRSSDAVYVFDRYDRGSWAEDFLWWDLMTDGRIDGDFIPEVGSHRRAHPGYAYHRQAWDDGAPPDASPDELADDAGFDAS